MAVLIFDYDGTIHDSMCIYEPAVRHCYEMMHDAGLMPEKEISTEEIRSYLGLSIKEMWLKFAPELPEDERDAGGKYIGQELREGVKNHEARLYEGALDVLVQLKKAGYKLVYLSNCTESYMKLHRDAFNLPEYFDEMYCSESFGWKEKWEIATELLRKWEVDGTDSVVAIGDRYKDIDMSKAGNIKTIWCAYGFGTEEEGQAADGIAHNVRDIPGLVEKLTNL